MFGTYDPSVLGERALGALSQVNAMLPGGSTPRHVQLPALTPEQEQGSKVATLTSLAPAVSALGERVLPAARQALDRVYPQGQTLADAALQAKLGQGAGPAQRYAVALAREQAPLEAQLTAMASKPGPATDALDIVANVYKKAIAENPEAAARLENAETLLTDRISQTNTGGKLSPKELLDFRRTIDYRMGDEVLRQTNRKLYTQISEAFKTVVPEARPIDEQLSKVVRQSIGTQRKIRSASFQPATTEAQQRAVVNPVLGPIVNTIKANPVRTAGIGVGGGTLLEEILRRNLMGR